MLSSDGQSFLWQPYPVDAIMCSDRVVWISRDMTERQLNLVAAEASYTVSTRGAVTQPWALRRSFRGATSSTGQPTGAAMSQRGS